MLPKSGRPIVRSTFWALTPNEKVDKKIEIDSLLNSIHTRIGDKKSDREVNDEIGDGHFFRADLFNERMIISTTIRMVRLTTNYADQKPMTIHRKPLTNI